MVACSIPEDGDGESLLAHCLMIYSLQSASIQRRQCFASFKIRAYKCACINIRDLSPSQIALCFGQNCNLLLNQWLVMLIWVSDNANVSQQNGPLFDPLPEWPWPPANEARLTFLHCNPLNVAVLKADRAWNRGIWCSAETSCRKDTLYTGINQVWKGTNIQMPPIARQRRGSMEMRWGRDGDLLSRKQREIDTGRKIGNKD